MNLKLTRNVDVVNSTEINQRDRGSRHVQTSSVQEEQNARVMSENSHVLQSALAIIVEMTMGRVKANQVLQKKKEE